MQLLAGQAQRAAAVFAVDVVHYRHYPAPARVGCGGEQVGLHAVGGADFQQHHTGFLVAVAGAVDAAQACQRGGGNGGAVG